MDRIQSLAFPILLCLTACISITPTPTPAEVTSILSIKYLALGDSYTIGESIAENERWPNQLAELIRSSPKTAKPFGGIEGNSIEVSLIARTGWTTSELWQGIEAAKPEPPYDLVSLLIGVNNQYRGYDIKEYRDEFRFLLQKSIEYADGDPRHVIVLSIPDWGGTPFAADRDRAQIAKEIDAFNAVNRAETDLAGAWYVDITPISRQAIHDLSLVASDGLHPSGKMYAEWARLVYPEVLHMLHK
jgi:lysophospholipase L1-like esterase